MDHVAIMKPVWKLIPKILNGQKTIESRWYQHRVAPWNRIKVDERIFFKDSGKPVSAMARVSFVIQKEARSIEDLEALVQEYAEPIQMVERNPNTWKTKPRYVILMGLAEVQPITPFHIDKTGFGSAAAWLVVEDVEHIKKK